MLITEDEAKALTAKIFALSKADSALVSVQSERLVNTRFANNPHGIAALIKTLRALGPVHLNRRGQRRL